MVRIQAPVPIPHLNPDSIRDPAPVKQGCYTISSFIKKLPALKNEYLVYQCRQFAIKFKP
jgi:hypothetical protein